MMNVFALGFLFTTLVTAGLFTPSPEIKNSKENVIVKEGHRVVVVEFEKDDGSTKVSISPQDSQPTQKVDEKGFVIDAKEKVSEKMEDAKEKMKDASSSVIPEEEIPHGFSPRELVCDAYGKCKHKIESAIGKTKEAMGEKAHEIGEEAKEVANEAIGKVKDTVRQTAHRASEKARETEERAQDVALKAGEKASETKERMKDAASEVSSKAKDKASEMKEGAKEKAKEAEDMVENVSDKAKKGAQRVKKQGQKELRDIFRRTWRLAFDVFSYLVPPVSMSSVSGVLHLLGFAAAYGMGFWVTFASSYVLAGALPRYQFGMVQSKIYPVYFKAMAYSVGVALLTHLTSKRIGSWMLQAFILAASLVMTLVNLLYLEPRATKVMFERMKKEKEDGSRLKEVNTTEPSGKVVDSTMTESVSGVGGRRTTGATTTTSTQEKTTEEAASPKPTQIIRSSEILQRLNSYSSLLNVATLMALTSHLVCLGHRINTAGC